MLRRVFLLQILLGWLLVIAKKIEFPSADNSLASLSLNGSIIEPIVFFVATNGNDAWSGKQSSPNGDRSDGPFATWQQAQRAIRKLRSQSPQLDRPIKVMFGSGTYRLTEPIILGFKDSGTKLSPVTYQAQPRNRVVFSGGRVITGWQEQQHRGLRMWTAKLPASLQGVKFQQLWVNDRRRERSRYPNRGYLQVKAVDNKPQQNWTEGHRSFQYSAADLTHQFDPVGGEAVVMNRWVESRLPISRIDPSERTIYFDKESVFRLAAGDLYYLENVWEFFDTPGEWYLDHQQSRLYYLPLPNETIANTEIVAPVLSTLVKLVGQATKNRPVSYLNFDNLAFAHTDWRLPADLSGYSQNALGVPATVYAIAAHNCCWQYCTFKHLGNHGIELFRGCQYNRIEKCSFYDLGAGGIKIGERTTHVFKISPGEVSHHNAIVYNHIYDGGKFFPSAVGIRLVHSHDNLIAHNHVHDLYYTGISARGTWGFQPTQAYNNIIEHNYVHHIGKPRGSKIPILSDMGGIYTLGRQKGSVIGHNKIHDVSGLSYGGWGIYLDEGSSYIVIKHNLVYRTSHGGFAQHYGRQNVIRNNVFAYGKQAQIHRAVKDLKFARQSNFISFYFVENVVYWQDGEFISGLGKNAGEKAFFQDNIYWKVDRSSFLLGGLSWWQWRKQDRYSQIVDPLFVAPEQNNFQLQPDSPALSWRKI